MVNYGLKISYALKFTNFRSPHKAFSGNETEFEGKKYLLMQ